MTLQYEVLERVAVGGMAEVYRARAIDGELTSTVCIKRILPHLTQDPRSLSMFIDEARLAASLRDPRIVQVYDLCRSPDGEHFIVMEFVEGLDLAKLLSRCRTRGFRIPVEVSAKIAADVCLGLHAAHEHRDGDGAPLNVVHRDISPQNVLISHQGEVKITDFGIAKSSIVMTTTVLGVLKGKYGYMSPEQASGQELDRRSDLFNVGILMYEMLVGERCFSGASDYSTLELMREASVVPPRRLRPDIEPQLEQVVLTALAREREQRFRTAEDMRNAILLCANVTLASEEDVTEFCRTLDEPERPPVSALPADASGILSLRSIVERETAGGDTTTARDAEEPVDGSSPAARPPIVAPAALALLLLVSGWWFAGRGPSEADVALAAQTPTATELQARGEEITLALVSEPPGTRVRIDGVEMEGRTPLMVVRPVDAQEHRVRFELKGREPFEAMVRFDDHGLRTVRGELPSVGDAFAEVAFHSNVRVRALLEGELLAHGRNGTLKLPADAQVRVLFTGPAGHTSTVTVDPANRSTPLFIELP